MDEQRLGQAFRDAVQELPPASFGRDEVVAASRRATARRRSALVGGTLLGVAVLAGGLAAGGQLLPGETGGQPAAVVGDRGSDPGTLRTLDSPAAPTPESPSGQARSELAPCGPIDQQLAADLTILLANRGRAPSGPAGEVPEPCPAGSRAAAVPVLGGTLYVVLVPRVEQPEPVAIARLDGARGYAVMLTGGRGLTVISIPGGPGQPAPLAAELPDLARELALRAP